MPNKLPRIALTDPAEAKQMLDQRLAELCSTPYSELRAIGEGRPRWSFFGGRLQIGGEPSYRLDERLAPSGRLYQFEWFVADEGNDTVYVFVELLEERKVHRTLRDEFIMARDGSFLGEDPI